MTNIRYIHSFYLAMHRSFAFYAACRSTRVRRHAPVAMLVLAVHAALLLAIQSHWTAMPEPEVVVATVLDAELLSPTAPKAPPAPAAPASVKVKPNAAAPSKPSSPVPISPLLAATDTPQPVALSSQPSTVTHTTPPTGTLTQIAPAPSTTPTAAATPPKVELPSSSADYLNNPRPAYPAMSKRLGEQGKVLLRVLIEADGTASKAEIRTSSGFDRLDQVALQTVLRWRYAPGKRGGVPEAMWFNIPINFVLE